MSLSSRHKRALLETDHAINRLLCRNQTRSGSQRTWVSCTAGPLLTQHIGSHGYHCSESRYHSKRYATKEEPVRMISAPKQAVLRSCEQTSKTEISRPQQAATCPLTNLRVGGTGRNKKMQGAHSFLLTTRAAKKKIGKYCTPGTPQQAGGTAPERYMSRICCCCPHHAACRRWSGAACRTLPAPPAAAAATHHLDWSRTCPAIYLHACADVNVCSALKWQVFACSV